MDLLQRLTDDMKTAMKAGQKERLSVIRMLLSDVKNIDLDPKKPTAEQAVAAYAKKLRKSAEEMEKYGRPAEAGQILKELAIVDSYLPAKASAGDVEKLMDEFLAANSFTEKQLGQAMGQFMKLYGGKVDPGVVNPILKSRLAGK